MAPIYRGHAHVCPVCRNRGYISDKFGLADWCPTHCRASQKRIKEANQRKILSQIKQNRQSRLLLFAGLLMLFATLVLLIVGCAPVAITPARSLPSIDYKKLGMGPTSKPSGGPSEVILEEGDLAPFTGILLTPEELSMAAAQIKFLEESRQLSYELGRNEVLPSLALSNRRVYRWNRWGPLGIVTGVVLGVTGGLFLPKVLKLKEVR